MTYKVLSASKKKPSAWIVEGKGLSKTEAKALAKKERGIWCGATENSNHKKSKNYIKGQHCYRLYSKIMKE